MGQWDKTLFFDFLLTGRLAERGQIDRTRRDGGMGQWDNMQFSNFFYALVGYNGEGTSGGSDGVKWDSGTVRNFSTSWDRENEKGDPAGKREYREHVQRIWTGTCRGLQHPAEIVRPLERRNREETNYRRGLFG